MDEQMKQWVDRGYGFVRIPRTDLLPLCLVGGPKGNLQALGTVGRLVRGKDGAEVTLPTPRSDASTFAMDMGSSASFSAAADASAVTSMLGSKGANIEASGKLSSECEMTLTYPSLKASAVSMDDLDRLFEVNTHREPPSDLAALADNRPGRVRDLLNAQRLLYVVMEVVQADQSVDLTVKKKGGGSLDAQLKEELAKVSVSAERAKNDTFQLELTEPRTIAFRCLRLWWNDREQKWAFETMRNNEVLAFSEEPGADEIDSPADESGWVNLG